MVRRDVSGVRLLTKWMIGVGDRVRKLEGSET
jgi:hypothetical protein